VLFASEGCVTITSFLPLVMHWSCCWAAGRDFILSGREGAQPQNGVVPKASASAADTVVAPAAPPGAGEAEAVRSLAAAIKKEAPAESSEAAKDTSSAAPSSG
jgi:hypothetical protein